MSTTLTGPQRATMERRLEEAREALHKLQIGGSAKVFVDQNGERIEYNSATVLQLTKYIRELEMALGLGGITGPLSVWM